MDREELINKLQVFKKTCSEKGYIYDELTFDEAYPDIVPTSFIVNVVAKKSWLYSTIGEALDKLIDVLWDTAEKKTRESVFTLSLYTLEEMVNSEKIRDREQAATNPDLTLEQIEKLRVDKENSVSNRVAITHIKASELTNKELHRIFDTNDDSIIALLNKRFSEDKDFSELVLSKEELKAKMVAIKI
jgi:hypothetical protein